MFQGIRIYAVWNQLSAPSFASIDTHSSACSVMLALSGEFNLEINYEFLGLGHFDWSKDVEFSRWLVFCEPEVIHFEAASYKITIENYQINIDQIIVAKNIFAPVGDALNGAMNCLEIISRSLVFYQIIPIALMN